MFGRVILVLVLCDKTFPGKIICFALSASPEFHLVPLEVGLVFDHFNKRLQENNQYSSMVIPQGLHTTQLICLSERKGLYRRLIIPYFRSNIHDKSIMQVYL